MAALRCLSPAPVAMPTALPQRVLVLTDFSTPAARALRYAADLAAAVGAEVELVHVCGTARAPPPTGENAA